jgi:3-oxoacyl-[acyl-carrier protein] reductase
MRLENQVAVVTGGVSGIGKATSLALVREGAAVAVNYSKSEADAKTTARELQDAGGRFLLVKADVSDEAAVRTMLDRVMAEFGRIDLLVNNAATTTSESFLELDASTWDHVMAVNLRGPFLCTKHFGRTMLARGSGSIVNISSRAGFVPEGSSVPYSVSKAGLMMLTKCSASALAPSVRVNAVAPGFTMTPWHSKHAVDVDRLTQSKVAQIPLQRPGQPDDIASAVVFLASDEASFITGQTLLVDGGLFMR